MFSFDLLRLDENFKANVATQVFLKGSLIS